ncbi:CaiB/BaiF CoA transferase family protein [Chloroflexota bacterium]
MSGIKVLDIGHYIAGPYCTKLLADFGAEVIKVERPDGGDPARRLGPFPDDKPDQEASGLFFYLNNNKKSITLNLKTDSGAKLFKELVKNADILVENFSPRVMPSLGLSYDILKAINPGLVITSISNFGQSGPYRDFKATDIVVQSVGGWMYTRGESTREPVRAASGLGISGYIGGMYGATGTMTALAYKHQSGIGQHVDVSLMDSVYAMLPYPVAMKNFPHNPGATERGIYTPNVEECKDGYVGMYTVTGVQWRDLCLMMGMNDWAEDSTLRLGKQRRERREEVIGRMRPWLMNRTGEEVLTEGQAWRVPIAMVYNTEDMLQSSQHRERDYFVEVEHPVLGKVTQPGAPFRMTETPWEIKRPAPLLGEHNEEVYCNLLSYSKEDVVRLRQCGVI